MSSRACCCPARCSRTLLQCGSRDCGQRSVGTVAVKLVRAQDSTVPVTPVPLPLISDTGQPAAGRSPRSPEGRCRCHRVDPRQASRRLPAAPERYGNAGLRVSVSTLSRTLKLKLPPEVPSARIPKTLRLATSRSIVPSAWPSGQCRDSGSARNRCRCRTRWCADNKQAVVLG